MPENWYQFAVKEIENSTRRMTDWEREFFYGVDGDPYKTGVKQRVEMGLSLTKRQEESLLKLHQKMTDVKRSRT